MSVETALLAAIWDQLHDDTPRLVYADWLEETGDPANVARAEFIRLQCEAARLDEFDPIRQGLEKREQVLARRHRRDWNGGLPKPLTRARFDRGFVYPRMRGVRGSQFLALTPADLAPAPLWSFRIEQATKVWPAVADSPGLRRVDHLDLGSNLLSEPAAVRVLASGNLANVSKLWLRLSRFTPPALAALAGNDALSHLRDLTFGSNQMTDETFAPLAGSARLAGVRTLNLTQNRLTAETVRSLVASVHTAGLRYLDLFGNPIGNNGVRALTRSPLRLRTLSLWTTGMTDESASDLAAWPGLGSLRALWLGGNQLTATAARALAASPHFTDGVFVSFWHTPLERDRAAVRVLRERFGNGAQFYNVPR